MALGLIVTWVGTAGITLHLKTKRWRFVLTNGCFYHLFPSWISSSPRRLCQRSPVGIHTQTRPAGRGSGHRSDTGCWHSGFSGSHSVDPRILPGRHTGSLWPPPGTKSRNSQTLMKVMEMAAFQFSFMTKLVLLFMHKTWSNSQKHIFKHAPSSEVFSQARQSVFSFSSPLTSVLQKMNFFRLNGRMHFVVPPLH